MVYQWKARIGAPKGVGAQQAGEVCAQLEAHGQLTAANLVDVSRPADAPLHRAFEWNDAVAGEEWRKHQARNIINAIVLVQEEKPPVRAFFSLHVQEPEYTSVETILRDEDLTARMLENALNELEAFRHKYNTLVQLAPVFSAIDAVKEETHDDETV